MAGGFEERSLESQNHSTGRIPVHLHWLPWQRCQWLNGQSLVSQPKMAFQVPSEQHCLLLNAELNSLSDESKFTYSPDTERNHILEDQTHMFGFILLSQNIHDGWKFFLWTIFSFSVYLSLFKTSSWFHLWESAHRCTSGYKAHLW